MERGNLFFTIGVQRSGKSTFCEHWVRYNDDQTGGYNRATLKSDVFYPKPRALACADNIRLALHGQRYCKEAEPMVWAIHTYMVKALLDRGSNVLVDGTNSTKESIKRILRIDINAQYILIDTPKEICLQRAIQTGQEDLLPVIERCHRQLEELKAEGINKVIAEIREEVRGRYP